MEDKVLQLLTEITNCPEAKRVRSGNLGGSSHCHKIVSSQSGSSFQLPEPWSGRIDEVPLLFVSSNPSIDDEERYPDEGWDSELTIDFFRNRFDTSKDWVKGGLHPLLKKGGWRKTYVHFWASARARAAEVYQKDRKAVELGIDFALTEVVHCKSRDEEGVLEAMGECADRYLKRVISISAAKVLIIYGSHAKKAMLHCLGSELDTQKLNLVPITDSQRMLIFLRHPGCFGRKETVADKYGDEGLLKLRGHMNK
jgi:hypothetical protein